MPPSKTERVNLRNLDREQVDLPSESTAQKVVPLPIIGVIDTEVGIGGQKRVICVETFNIVCAIEFWVVCREFSALDQDVGETR